MKTMITRLLVAGCLLALSAVGSLVAAQTEGFDVPGSCVQADASSNPVVRVGVPSGAVADGIVGCKIIHNGDRFVLSPAVIGNLGVIQRGVQASVEVYGIAGGGGVTNFGQQLQVCLRGTGELIYLSAANTPRVPSALPAFTRDIQDTLYTCGNISSTGVAVLVAGEQAPPMSEMELAAPPAADGDVETADADADTDSEIVTRSTTLPSGNVIVSLSGCRVTTTAMVRMRSEPTTQGSEVLARLPFEFSLQAINRTADEDWYNVIYRDENGWVSGSYLTASAGCFE